MKSIFTLTLTLAASLSVASTAGVGAELTDWERSEMRERANALHTQRVQNPGAPTGDVPLDRPRGDVKLGEGKGEIKARPRNTKKKKLTFGKKKPGRSLGDLPGARVRRR